MAETAFADDLDQTAETAARLRAEPCTAQALWPTFMRRTLEADAVTPAPRPLATRPHDARPHAAGASARDTAAARSASR